jgi:DNA-binding beta-propeller fold protein YncE
MQMPGAEAILSRCIVLPAWLARMHVRGQVEEMESLPPSASMRVIVSSARGANGNGYGAILAFDPADNAWGTFGADGRIVDPRGLCVAPGGDLLHANSGDNRIVALDRTGQIVRDTGPIGDLDLGGGVFGPDGRYYAGSRRLRTVMALPASLDGPALPLLAPEVVPFPRGFAFAPDGRIYLASGTAPTGRGEETIKVFDADGRVVVPRLVDDPQLSPLDLTIAPNGNVLVSSEWPFGAEDASTSVREYDSTNGHLVRIFKPDGAVRFRNPRGLRFGPDGSLCCVARDEVVRFDFEAGSYAGVIVRLPDLFGQAVEFFD